MGLARYIVVQIMKFADLRIAALEHFDVERLGNGAHLIRCQAVNQAVHAVSPAPEAV